jgi:hypothetical protein
MFHALNIVGYNYRHWLAMPLRYCIVFIIVTLIGYWLLLLRFLAGQLSDIA